MVLQMTKCPSWMPVRWHSQRDCVCVCVRNQKGQQRHIGIQQKPTTSQLILASSATHSILLRHLSLACVTSLNGPGKWECFPPSLFLLPVLCVLNRCYLFICRSESECPAQNSLSQSLQELPLLPYKVMQAERMGVSLQNDCIVPLRSDQLQRTQFLTPAG